ncbi:MAG TPA: methyl-accepting chemotaxis protein [Paludibaculum sp.]|jgi:methyl-accepting chemotaxis protein/methyl-accepting chemotaxis protein-1 (serine sensor receptor)
MQTKKKTLGFKIYLASGLLAAFLLILSGFTVFTITSLQSKMNALATQEVRKVDLAGRVASGFNLMWASARGILIGTMTGKQETITAAEGTLQQGREQVATALQGIEPLLNTDEGKRIVASFKNHAGGLEQNINRFQNAIKGQRLDEAVQLLTVQMRQEFISASQESKDFLDLQERLVAATAQTADQQVSISRLMSILLSLLTLAVAAGLIVTFYRSNRELQQIAGEIGEGSRQVAGAAQQVSGSSQALAQGSSEQAASLEETSASTEEINSMTQKNAENARHAATETEKADQLLKETDHKLTQMIGSMREINSSSEKISKIIRVIDEIAFQTNILALNAAVEAARAGEAGMGFAVVADEVRNLAQRCAQAAKDTSDLIEESIVRSNEGKTRLDEVAHCVTRVFDNATRIKELSNEVHVGSQEQARGIEQISRSVAQMQQVTQSTAASAEESASAGEEMSAQAHSLNDAVRRLNGLVGGAGEAAGAPAKARREPPRAKATMAGAPPVRKPLATVPAAKRDFPLDGDFSDF